MWYVLIAMLGAIVSVYFLCQDDEDDDDTGGDTWPPTDIE